MSKFPVSAETLAAQLRGFAEERGEDAPDAICMQRAADRLEQQQERIMALESQVEEFAQRESR